MVRCSTCVGPPTGCAAKRRWCWGRPAPAPPRVRQPSPLMGIAARVNRRAHEDGTEAYTLSCRILNCKRADLTTVIYRRGHWQYTRSLNYCECYLLDRISACLLFRHDSTGVNGNPAKIILKSL